MAKLLQHEEYPYNNYCTLSIKKLCQEGFKTMRNGSLDPSVNSLFK